MLTDPEERTIVSSLGWVDGGALWVLDVETGRTRTDRLGDAKYLDLHAGLSSHFTVLHHYDGTHVVITVHSFSRPNVVLGRCDISRDECRIEGQAEVWALVPRYYVAYLVQPAWSDFALITVDPAKGAVLQTFEWYDESYDKGYQGIIGVTEVPGSEIVIVSVQRSSTPILYDPEARKKVGELSLSGRPGDPRLYFRQTADELWADDYDTLLKIQPHSWQILKELRLQEATSDSFTAEFIGQFAFNTDETVCGVARPFSGDVIGLDPVTFDIRYRAVLGSQPLEVAVLRDGRVFARDWKSGALLEGTFRRIDHE
jgi:hypothetical protein